MTTPNKRVVREFLEALRVEDSGRLRAIITDDMVWWLPRSTMKALGLPDAIRGGDEVVAFNERMLQSTYTSDIDKQFVIHRLIEDGDMVATMMMLKTVTPEGRPYENDYVYLSRVRDGKIAEQWTYVDTAHAYDALLPDE